MSSPIPTSPPVLTCHSMCSSVQPGLGTPHEQLRPPDSRTRPITTPAGSQPRHPRSTHALHRCPSGTHGQPNMHVISTCSPTCGPHNVPGCAPRRHARKGRGRQAPQNPSAMHAAHKPRTLQASSVRAPPPPCSAAASAAAARQRAGPAREGDTWRARGRRRGCVTYRHAHGVAGYGRGKP